jgi:pimeloyl-ACP methyl ester carboxylesterase
MSTLSILMVLVFTSMQVFANQPVTSFPSEECKTFVTQTLPKLGWSSGTVEVPLNWKKPDGRKLNIFYYYDASRDLNTATPIMFLNGGPSTSFQSATERMSKKFAEYDKEKNHVFIMMDQRGVGCSSPLNPFPNQTIEEYALFGSDQIVHDTEAIRAALFKERKWKLFAQSYGGVIAKRYVALYPQFVKSVHVFDSAWQNSMTDFFLYRIVKQTIVYEKFVETYKKDPDVQKAIDFMMDPSQADKICTKVSDDVGVLCGRVLLSSVLAGIGNGKGAAPGTTERWDGIADTLKAVLSPETQKKFFDSAISGLAFFSSTVNRYRTASIWSRDHTLINGNYDYDCAAAEGILRDKFKINPASLPLNECVIIKEGTPAVAKKGLQGKIKPHLDRVTAKRLSAVLKKNKQIKFYLYTAELGTSTLEDSLKEYTRIPQIIYQVAPETGHNGWNFYPDLWEKMMQN